MERNYKQSEKFLKAKKQVEHIKNFYKHLRVYIIINLLLLVVKFNLIDWFKDDYEWIQNPGFSDWVSWNIVGTPIIWGLGLLVHAAYVFKFGANSWKELKPAFLKRWEKRQLQKFLEEENRNGEYGK